MRILLRTLGLRGSCEVCQVQSLAETIPEKEVRTMKKQHDPFYDSIAWRRLRQKVLRRDHYMCQITKRYGRLVEAQTVHHIFPREFFPEWQLSPWNLISLTFEAHHSMHDRENDRLTAEGLELLRRTARLNHIENVDELIARME